MTRAQAIAEIDKFEGKVKIAKELDNYVVLTREESVQLLLAICEFIEIT